PHTIASLIPLSHIKRAVVIHDRVVNRNKENAADRGSAASSLGGVRGIRLLSATLPRVVGELRADRRIGVGAGILVVDVLLGRSGCRQRARQGGDDDCSGDRELAKHWKGLRLLASRCGSLTRQ